MHFFREFVYGHWRFLKHNARAWARKPFVSDPYSIQRIQQNLLPTLKDIPSNADASVLVLISNEKIPHLLLSKRALHLKHHPGEVSFVGGKRDPDDHSDIDVALRECYEEIGLKKEDIQIIGILPMTRAKSGAFVRPIVATTNRDIELNIQDDEIDYIFWAPLSHFISAKLQYYSIQFRGQSIQVPSFYYHDNVIWGLTARIIINFLQLGTGKIRYWPIIAPRSALKLTRSALKHHWKKTK